jgi:hypothetical protein
MAREPSTSPPKKGKALIFEWCYPHSRNSEPHCCIKKMADNWETLMNIESKPSFGFKAKAGRGVQPEEYIEYFEYFED